MKNKFSKSWKASKQPRRQKKFVANAPLHLRKNFVRVNLDKKLREKVGKRNIVLKKGDKVKIMRGKFKGKQGKVLEVKLKLGKIYVEGLQAKKNDGSKVNVPMRNSNLQIVEMTDRQSSKKKENKKELKESKENTLKGTSKK